MARQYKVFRLIAHHFYLAYTKAILIISNCLIKKLGVTLTAEGGDIKGLYMDDGYLFCNVNPVEIAVYNDTIDYEIRIVEGPQATFKNIKIIGNDRTKEYVIRRELRTLPGEKFSRTDVIRSTREIANLGFLTRKKLHPILFPTRMMELLMLPGV